MVNLRNLAALTIALHLVSATLTWGAPAPICTDLLLQESQSIQAIVKTNGFMTKRPFSQYRSLLGEPFAEALLKLSDKPQALGKTDWIDIGAGEAAAMSPGVFPSIGDIELPPI
ncbi:MAG: hypothetical protein H7301_08330 [Cryobacterium sp.]|nr:hypothetical protein [Oligoflexia bacterium]